MNRIAVIRGILCGLMCLAFLCSVALADMNETVAYQGNKARVAVGKIKDKARGCSWEVAQAVGEMLSTALTNSGRFIVLASQEEVDELIEEIDFGQSGYAEEGRGPDKGLMEGADILVTGAVTGFEPDAGGTGGGLGGLKKKAFGAFGAKKKSAKILMDIKLVDIRTRRIIKALSLEGKSTSWKVGGIGGGWTKDIALVGALGTYSNEPMEKAVRNLLAKTTEKISKEVPDEYFRYKGGGQYTTEYATPAASASAGQPASDAASPAASGASAVPAAPVADDMTLYTKYDFVPGNRVIFYDDMKNEEEGEFPYRWNLDRGVFEVVRLGNEFWIMCTNSGSVRPKTPEGPLPPRYTAELEYFDNGPGKSGHYFYICWVNSNGQDIGSFGICSRDNTWLEIRGKTLANKALSQKPGKGVHTMRIMATDRSIKCFIDRERVANVPRVENFDPVGFRLKLSPYSDPDNPNLFRGFRFAEGGKSMRQQLDEDGKIVTHGILFDPDSYVIKGGSYKTLQNIGRLLQDDAQLRLSIEGHTDSDGSDDHNLTLSQNRAKSVQDYLISTYGIAADRLESKGWGESKPIDANDTAEGKANNRRVELVKL
jgi:OOP family OmpA-OmpF porin